MRITLLSSLFPPLQVGGAEKSVGMLAAALGKSGDSVSVISLHPESTPSWEGIDGVSLHRLPLRNSYWPWGDGEKPHPIKRVGWHIRDAWNRGAARDVGAVLDAEQPDVLHVNTLAGFSPVIWTEARRRSIPIVQTLRDYGLMCSRATLFRRGRICVSRCGGCRLMTFTRSAASGLPDLIVSNSQFVIDEHRRQGLFQNTPAEVIFNIADVNLRAERRPSFSQEPDLIFGYIGRIEPEKGIEVVLQALRKLPLRGWRLTIAGRGRPDYMRDLHKRSGDLPITWLGFTTPDEFYSAVDTVLVSSIWHEPLPRTLIESFAAGRSTICSDRGGIPEISSLSPVSASYPARDVGALAALLMEALSNGERWRFGAAGMKIPNGFSEQVVVSRYKAAYARACKIARKRSAP